MAVGKANYNGTATSGATKQIAPANASRTSFFFKSLGDTFVLNFGDSATASNILQVNPNEAVLIESGRGNPYEIRDAINVYCASASNYEAQAEEFSV